MQEIKQYMRRTYKQGVQSMQESSMQEYKLQTWKVSYDLLRLPTDATSSELLCAVTSMICWSHISFRARA